MTPLDLSEAQAQWATGNDWKIVSGTGELLWTFPASFSEADVMSAIRMGREYELKAFNNGIELGKSEARKLMQAQIQSFRGEIRSLSIMNEDLSTQLERHIGAN